ncbi:MAG TPA: MazG nucleotide pyrophosphohydrolase domain-containing protein [Rickettsiales bacterium]|nr:MazG nucleotide pyrophosphohydrolase domain-containing protein [Rickettsiales bacterium]
MLKEKFNKINENGNLIASQETQKFIKKTFNFGYETKEAILQDLDDEVEELKDELLLEDKERIKEELGDVVFVLCNLANQYDINIEEAIEYSNKEFQRRFIYMENKIGKANIKDLKTSDIVKLWKEAKMNKGN